MTYGLAGAAAALPAAWAAGIIRLAEWKGPWLTLGAAAGTFFGVLWVVALSEEFFFRGLLQQWLEQFTGRAAAALLLASALFGAAHLGFRQFPNWQFALLAAAMGVVYGLAFRAGGGIRAAMVAHALVVVIWRVGFA
jgi:membrane protease YdiL (CAAX protease family)